MLAENRLGEPRETTTPLFQPQLNEIIEKLCCQACHELYEEEMK